MKKLLHRNKIKSESVEGKITDKLDVYLLISSLSIIIIGLISIYSSTLNIPTLHINFYKQLTFAVIGIFVGLIIYNLPLKYFRLVAMPFYVFSILLLVVVLFLGKKVSGNQAWINIGFFSLQPSEISKFAVILLLSEVFSRKNFNVNSLKGFLIVASIVLLPTALIVLQKIWVQRLSFLNFNFWSFLEWLQWFFGFCFSESCDCWYCINSRFYSSFNFFNICDCCFDLFQERVVLVNWNFSPEYFSGCFG